MMHFEVFVVLEEFGKADLETYCAVGESLRIMG